MANIRIVSDGTAAGTRVYDPEGRELVGVTRVSWAIDARTRLAHATVEFAEAAVEVVADDSARFDRPDRAFAGERAG